MNAPALHIHPDPDTLYRATAERIAALAASAVERRGAFFIALSGGSTPRGLYERLAAPPYVDRVPWANTHVFFGDERCVPPDHPDSNYRMAHETLLSHVPIPSQQIHPMQVALASVRQDAARYAGLLEQRVPHDDHGLPIFDLILLGLGPDGHTASLFPNTCILHERSRPVAAVYVSKLHAWRLSLTPPVIEHARHILFLVAGRQKAEILADVFADTPEALPVRLLQPTGQVEWLVDQAAAQQLTSARQA